MISKFKKIISYVIPIVVEKRRGEISPKLEIAIENGRYVLNTSHFNYSFGGLHKIFESVFEKLDIQKKKIKNVLLLGFGTGSVAELLLEKYKKDCRIVGIERDAVVIELAHKYFNIDRFRDITLYHADAFKYVHSCEEKFDLIVIDVFVGSKVPPYFEDEKFLLAINKLISVDGIVLYNRAFFDQQSRKDTLAVAKKMELAMGKTAVIKINAYGLKNCVLVHDKKENLQS